MNLKCLTRKRTALILGLVCFLAAVCIGYISVEAADQEEGPVTVRVGYYENEVFEEGAYEGAVKTGYAYEYYRKLSEYTGWRYEYVYGSFSDIYQKLLSGEVDLMAGLARTREREGLIGYPETAMGNEAYSLVKHDSDEKITVDPNSLAGSRIGVLDSAVAGVLKAWLDDHKVEADIVTFSDYAALFDAFDNKKVDVLAAEGDGAYGREHSEVLMSFGTSDYYLCVTVGRQDILEELNNAQTELFTDEPGYLNTLHAKYYSRSVSSRSFSSAEKEWLADHDQLKVGYLNNYLPYSSTDEDGNVTGIIKDLMPRMLDGLGISNITVTYQGYDSYDDMIADMGSSKIDAAFPVGGGLYYSEENGIYQSNAVAASSTELVYKGEYDDGKAKHFAVNENNRMQYYYIKSNFPDADMLMCSSIEECLSAVLSGKADCTTLNGLRANDILKNSKYKDLSLRQLSHSDERCFGVQIGNEGLLKLLNHGINVVGDDYAQNLAYRYTQGLYTVTFMDMVREHMGVFAGIILALAALIIAFLLRDAGRTKKQVAEKEKAREALEKSKTDLEEKNRELEENKRALEENREALSDALVAAEHANRAKTTFLNNMSHDIRTPMNAIVGFTALAGSHIDNKEQVQDYLSKISVSSQHLLSLINDVLDMSRIESGKVTIEETETSLPDLIHDLRTIIQANITAKQLELFIDTQDVVSENIITDKLRLNQVLLNILSNAIKFTPNGGIISFRVIEKPSHKAGVADFEFRIRDNGIGMSEEFQKNIFEAFTREQTSTVSGIQGTGLGMAITKNIVDMMGGSISVNSEEGKGSEFIVEIPCRVSGRPASYEQLPELSGLRALVADDDTNTCLSVCSMLREIGMRPDWTNYGKEAVIRAKDAMEYGDAFSAYIIDWMMPDLNGIETVRRIRRVIGDSAPIIILTAYDWADIEEEAKEAGVTAFCAKPLFMSELRNVLSRSWHNREETGSQEKEVDFRGKRLLLAEDNELNQIIAIEILKDAGFEIEVAADGLEVVRMMQEAEAGYYDAILMDIQMPHMDGYEAAREIRKMEDEAKASIPIIAVTANAFEEDKAIAREAGMNGHLAKPYDIPEMMKTLGEVL